MKISTVGLFGKFNDASVIEPLNKVRNILQKRQLDVLLGGTTAPEIEGQRLNPDLSIRDQLDLAIAVGGDGTMLNVARTLAEHQVPTIGVNQGRLGFLTDIALQDFESAFDDIQNGHYQMEQRTLLKTTVFNGEEEVFTGISLNDAVISKGNSGRLIEFETTVNDKFVSHTRSDGLIIATPTGSTAYSLSAGGPIIYPTLPVFSMAPICPHTLSNRPIVLDENAIIEISALSCPEVHANLALDGLIVCKLHGQETLRMEKAQDKLLMIRINSHNHFETLHSKLGWNG